MHQPALRSTPWSLVVALVLVAGTGTWFARGLRTESVSPSSAALPTGAPPSVAARDVASPAAGRIAATIPAAGRVTAALYTRAGALVRTLARQVALPAGRIGLPWDGRDERGRTVPPGAYALRVEVTSPHVRALRVTAVSWPATADIE
jgi:hypothetical protein